MCLIEGVDLGEREYVAFIRNLFAAYEILWSFVSCENLDFSKMDNVYVLNLEMKSVGVVRLQKVDLGTLANP